MANTAISVPVLQKVTTAISRNGEGIQLDLEAADGERLRCGLTPEGAVNLATALLEAHKAAAERSAKKQSVS